MKKAVIVFALAEEVVEISWPNYEIIPVVTGVGKACAAIATTKAILTHRPDVVISVGSVGTFTHEIGDIFVSTHFVDRDLAKLPLNGLAFEGNSTNFMADRFPSIVNQRKIMNADFVVSTGDDFVTEGEAGNADVVDMESFAIYLACTAEGVPFIAVKYVTDVIGKNSVALWECKLSDARKTLNAYFQEYTLD